MSDSVSRALALVVGFSTYAIMRWGIGLPIEATVMLLAMMLIPYAIGLVTGKLLVHNSDADSTGFQIVGLGNLVAWMIPIVGVAVATITSVFGSAADRHKFRFRFLASLGVVASLVNASYGSLASIDRQYRERMIRSMGYDPNLPHTRDRCAMAALEGWPEQDTQAVCR